MRRGIFAHRLIVAALLLSAAAQASAQTGGQDGARLERNNQYDARATGGIATMYALDPLSQTFCFKDGAEGAVFQDNQVKNRCSDINFTYYPGNFTVGIEGARLGTIVDLETCLSLSSGTDLRRRSATARASPRFALKIQK
jgi:hypothetical protein